MTDDSEEDRTYSPNRESYTTRSGERYSYDSDDGEFYRDISISSGSSGGTGGRFTGQTNKKEGDGWGWVAIACILLVLLGICSNIHSPTQRVNDSKLEKTIEKEISKPIEKPNSRTVPTRKLKSAPKVNQRKETIPYVELSKVNPDTNKIEVKPRVEVYQTERNQLEHEIEQDTKNIPFAIGKKQEYGSQKELESQFVDPVRINYESGKSYVIDKDEYPKLYKKLDLNGDGKISLFELYKINPLLGRIISKYKEGDIKSIAKEFLERY